ncbi:MAG: SET domain-containing protein-lysine N-methyltransferase [Anaerolineae bacterium]|nr:SET domain-containing protein-lysine N-methyltransferase [Anaerolineae bacterium]
MLHPLVEVEDFGVIQGKGLVARGLIRQGEVVSRLEPGEPMYLISEVLAMPQAEQDKLMHYAYQCSATQVVNEQGDERYMNHSCDPNTWWADNDTMIARRDIQPGEELTYDYATTDILVPFEMDCGCGSPHCRGRVTNLDYLDANWQLTYGEYLPDYTLACIKGIGA